MLCTADVVAAVSRVVWGFGTYFARLEISRMPVCVYQRNTCNMNLYPIVTNGKHATKITDTSIYSFARHLALCTSVSLMRTFRDFGMDSRISASFPWDGFLLLPAYRTLFESFPVNAK